MTHDDKLPDDLFRDMVAAVCLAFPQVGEALAVGGEHAADVLAELREAIVTGLRRRGYDL